MTKPYWIIVNCKTRSIWSNTFQSQAEAEINLKKLSSDWVIEQREIITSSAKVEDGFSDF